MANKKQSHVGFRNGALFCFNCGESYQMPVPQPLTIATAIMKQFDKDHKPCLKTWKEPEPINGKTEDENIEWWFRFGEQGISSKTIFNRLSRISKIPNQYGEMPPSDPDDFRRCYLLLEAIPQWKTRLNELKPINKTWSNLVDNWDKLTEMLIDLMQTKKDNGMYKFMKSLEQN